jgi:hypothetical protein
MKISKAKLIESIKGKMAQEQQKYDEACAEYLASFAENKEKLIRALKESIKAAETATEFAHLQFLRRDYYGQNAVVAVDATIPVKPRRPDSIPQMERALRKLELCAEETVTVRDHDEFSYYI